MNTTANTTTAPVAAPLVIALVEFLNGDKRYFVFNGKHYSTAEVNRLSAAAIKVGDIIEISGDPYRYELG